MKALEVLQNETNGKTTLPDLLAAFESMCQVPIEGVSKEEEMILFETGTFSFSGEPLFYFSLVRQFPNEEEEFCQIHLDIQYIPSDEYRAFGASVWDEELSEDIFEYIRKSEVYSALSEEEIYNIDVYMDET